MTSSQGNKTLTPKWSMHCVDLSLTMKTNSKPSCHSNLILLSRTFFIRFKTLFCRWFLNSNYHSFPQPFQLTPMPLILPNKMSSATWKSRIFWRLKTTISCTQASLVNKKSFLISNWIVWPLKTWNPLCLRFRARKSSKNLRASGSCAKC
jgi:hypothetical protein